MHFTTVFHGAQHGAHTNSRRCWFSMIIRQHAVGTKRANAAKKTGDRKRRAALTSVNTHSMRAFTLFLLALVSSSVTAFTATSAKASRWSPHARVVRKAAAPSMQLGEASVNTCERDGHPCSTRV